MSTTTCKKRKPYKRGAKNKTIKASTLLKEYFDKNDIIYYQRTVEQNVEVFLVPYDIQKQNIKLHIRIIVADDINLCHMSFNYELNKDTDHSKELLDMNSELIKGRLYVEKDSNQVTYTTNFQLTSESDVKTLYDKNFEICLSVLAKLYQKGIIKTNERTE